MSNRTATTFSPFPRPSAALPYPKHGRRRMPAPMRSPCIYIYIYKIIIFFLDSVKRVFCLDLSMRFSNWNSRSNRFVRAPPSGGGSNAPRSAVFVPHLPGRDRVRGLSETSEKRANFCVLGGIRPSYTWILAYAELERKKHTVWENNYFKVDIISKLDSYLVHPTTFFSWSHLEAFSGLLSFDCCVVAFRYRISRLTTFVRTFVVFEGGRSFPNDIITPSAVLIFILERYKLLLCGQTVRQSKRKNRN